MKKVNALAFGMLLGAAGTIAAQTAHRFRRDMHVSATRLQAGSQMIATARGPMECALVGDGPPLLCIHGVSGGYDMPLIIYPLLTGFRLIAPSRPGYLRTPLSTGRTPQEQADAYAALLDVLHIDRVAIVAASGGGPSSLHFALRHPDRCYALVMVSAVSHSIPEYPRAAQIANTLLRNYNFPSWLLTTEALGWAMQRTGITPAVRAQIEFEPPILHMVSALIQTYPVSLRSAGTANDLAQGARHLPVLGLERITAPTLVIHGDLDPIVPVTHAEYTAQSIPGATFLRIPDGGHLCMVTHHTPTFGVLNAFLHQHAPKAVSGYQ